MYSCEAEEMGLFVVADGMGGHAEGEIASRMITDQLKEWSEKFTADNYNGEFHKMMKSLENKIEEINHEIFSEYNQTQICGSTCILLFLFQDHYGIINIGDSRIYKKAGWGIKPLMKDDVWENRLDVKEKYTKKEILNHKNYGKLLQAVGIRETVSLASKTDLLKHGDSFLLCSDGLYKVCKEKDMRKILQRVSEDNLKDSVSSLMAKCYEAGARDNVSVIIVRCL